MTLLRFALTAAGSLFALTSALPVAFRLPGRGQTDALNVRRSSHTSAINHGDLVKRGANTYTMYTGNGQTSWPTQDQWLDFDTLFDQNTPIMKISCAQFQMPNNSDDEIKDIRNAIQSVAKETGVDDRFILAIVLQESQGCVRVPTTNGGVRNPGLMQDHDGKGTCNEPGNIQNPCPTEEIQQMIHDGVNGTTAGPGLKQLIDQATGSGTAKFYEAARMYNSGSIAASGRLWDGIATHCYCSDVANRLTGWSTAPKTCDESHNPDTNPTAPSATVPANSPPEPKPTTAPPAAPQPADPKPAPAPAATESATPPASPATYSQPSASLSNSHPSPHQPSPTKASASNRAPGVTDACAQFYTVQAGDYCDAVAMKFGVTFDDLRKLNTELDSKCSNLWLGYAYCVKSL